MKSNNKRQDLIGIIAGFLALAVAMGIGRFAYTPLLPYMEATHLSSFAAGFLASMNYLGYLIGALAARRIEQKRSVLLYSLWANVITTLWMGFTESMVLWSVLRLASGISSGLVFVLVVSLVMYELTKSGRLSWSGYMYGGVGFGIFISGVSIPFAALNMHWSYIWVLLGLFSLVAALFVAKAVPYDPPLAEAAATNDAQPPARKDVVSLYLSYTCEGFGYIIFGTFIVAMLEAAPEMHWPAGYIWAIAGIGAIPSCLFWAWLAKKQTVTKTLKRAYLVQIVSVSLPVISTSFFPAALAAFGFGATFMGIVMLTMLKANELFGAGAQRLVAGLTSAYALGQIAGPLVAVLLIQEGDYTLAFSLAAIVLIVGYSGLYFKKGE
ncbi:YbfB/YjiJ family MFS transporter [Salsuginibacillus kocurii]|uniref:YbfB/YjiJ family MFS transporter n=1 Tax=Salsuginibacillus kocurii TaxID=427078 RepID=UPI0003724648|nr:YbfB/YjiJ family MFS transporter [Salsuginibacillus kocurii]